MKCHLAIENPTYGRGPDVVMTTGHTNETKGDDSTNYQPIVQNTRESGTTYQALEGTKRGQPVAQTSSPVYQSLAPNSASKPAEQEGNYQPLAKNRDSYRRPGQERLLCKAPLIFSPPHPQFFLQFFPVGCTLIV